MKPLFGKRTRPLTEHALGILRGLLDDPRMVHTVNPGVVNRLLRENLVVEKRRVLLITDAGRRRVCVKISSQVPLLRRGRSGLVGRPAAKERRR